MIPLSPSHNFTLSVLIAQSVVQEWCVHPVPTYLHHAPFMSNTYHWGVGAQTRSGGGRTPLSCALLPFRIRPSFGAPSLAGANLLCRRLLS